MSPRAFDRYMLDVEAGRNLKLSRLKDGERLAFFVGILPIAAKSPIRGRLLVGELPAEPRDVALQASVSERVARNAMGRLRDLGVLLADDEYQCERVREFEEWNPPPKKDTTAAERQAKRRAKLAAERDVTDESRRDDRDCHGKVTPTEVEEKELPSGSSSSELAKASPDQLRLCRLLADLIRQHDSKFKSNPESTSWLRPMRLLLADRDSDAGEIERVIRWAQADEFWQTNILCPAKLRKQFTQLTIKMKAAGLRSVPRPAQPVAAIVAEGDRLIAEALATGGVAA